MKKCIDGTEEITQPFKARFTTKKKKYIGANTREMGYRLGEVLAMSLRCHLIALLDLWLIGLFFFNMFIGILGPTPQRWTKNTRLRN